jgi:hypothetical protein
MQKKRDSRLTITSIHAKTDFTMKTLSVKRATRILEKLSREAKDCTLLASISYGEVEAWNLATCYLQNAELDGCNIVSYLGSALCYESKAVQSYFRKLGFTF